jgi:hypothetical protein
LKTVAAGLPFAPPPGIVKRTEGPVRPIDAVSGKNFSSIGAITGAFAKISVESSDWARITTGNQTVTTWFFDFFLLTGC